MGKKKYKNLSGEWKFFIFFSSYINIEKRVFLSQHILDYIPSAQEMLSFRASADYQSPNQ